MKKIFYTAFILAVFVAESSAYNFACGAKNDGLWSTTKWRGTEGTATAIGQVPGPADYVNIGAKITLDKDVEIKSLHITSPGALIIDGRNFVVNSKMTMNATDSALILKKSKMQVDRKLETVMTPTSTTIKQNKISLEDSYFSLSSIVAPVPSSKLKTNTNSGTTVELKGKSELVMKNSFEVDDIFRGKNGSTLFFKIVMSESGGNIPVIKLGYADWEGIKVEVNVPETVKTGKHPLIIVADKSADFKGIRLFLNGVETAIDSKSDKFSFAVESVAKQGKTLMLIVKK